MEAEDRDGKLTEAVFLDRTRHSLLVRMLITDFGSGVWNANGFVWTGSASGSHLVVAKIGFSTLSEIGNHWCFEVFSGSRFNFDTDVMENCAPFDQAFHQRFLGTDELTVVCLSRVVATTDPQTPRVWTNESIEQPAGDPRFVVIWSLLCASIAHGRMGSKNPLMKDLLGLFQMRASAYFRELMKA